MADFPIFTGNCPKNVSKDAKYVIGMRGSKSGRSVVGLTYEEEEDRNWHLSTEEHEPLVEMVNAMKIAFNGKGGGPFYVNEYKQVIVPVKDSTNYYLAGIYEPALRFKWGMDKIISGEPKDPHGNPMQPGDRWQGPHAGIPYVLTAAGNDVYYKTWPLPELEQRIRLSKKRSKTTAEQIARLLSIFKGAGGGRIYVNEFCSVFSPINDDEEMEYIYFGQIDLATWFPKPMTEGQQVLAQV